MTLSAYAKKYDKLPGNLKDLWDAIWALEERITSLEDIYSLEFQGQFIVPYNIPAGTRQTWNFDCEYDITWETTIEFRSDYVSIMLAYRIGSTRYFVGSSGWSLSHLDYPPQTELHGTIYCDFYEGDYPEIWIQGYVSTQFPEVARSGSAFIDLS